jgi:UDP-glucuronate 4-epimerase
MEMATLVTGGAGFIGSHVVELLLAQGPVVVVDNFNDFYSPYRKAQNLKGALEHPRFRLVRGDVRDGALLSEVMRAQGVDRVIHLAAWAGVRPSVDNPRGYVQNNLEGTQSVLDACVAAGVSRLVFASSSSVYGDDSPRPSPESAGADRPLSPYAATKRAGELLCHAAHHLHGLSVTCLRFFTAVGPRQRPDLAVHRFARQLLAREPLTLFGDGSSVRDYTHVLDLAEGVLAASARCEGLHTYNLGTGRPLALKALVELLAEELGVRPTLHHLPARKGDVDATTADLTLAARDLGYAPRRGIEAAVRDFCAWLLGAQR